MSEAIKAGELMAKVMTATKAEEGAPTPREGLVGREGPVLFLGSFLLFVGGGGPCRRSGGARSYPYFCLRSH